MFFDHLFTLDEEAFHDSVASSLSTSTVFDDLSEDDFLNDNHVDERKFVIEQMPRHYTYAPHRQFTKSNVTSSRKELVARIKKRHMEAVRRMANSSSGAQSQHLLSNSNCIDKANKELHKKGKVVETMAAQEVNQDENPIANSNNSLRPRLEKKCKSSSNKLKGVTLGLSKQELKDLQKIFASRSA